MPTAKTLSRFFFLGKLLDFADNAIAVGMVRKPDLPLDHLSRSQFGRLLLPDALMKPVDPPALRTHLRWSVIACGPDKVTVLEFANPMRNQ